MRVVLFCHSLVSDWNHGNAHFLRGVVSELLARGHEVRVFEPAGGWSRCHLLADHGPAAIDDFQSAYPQLSSTLYDERLDVDEALDGAALALVHEWTAPELVGRLGARRARTPGLRLLFHDTHHRAVSAPHEIAAYDLGHYDGVLAFGEVLRDRYLERGWAQRAWVWHEAADVRVFGPRPELDPAGDLVWIGNWGDGERTAELREFLLEPAAALGLSARVHGVRYPADAVQALCAAGIRYEGWIANHRVPEVLARHRVTVHVPRRPYAQALPGIPTIRPFEAMACGIPLISSPWSDAEGLFTAGRDYLVVKDGEAMRRALRAVLGDPGLAAELSGQGRRTILERHTCGHRVDELLAIHRALCAAEASAA